MLLRFYHNVFEFDGFFYLIVLFFYQSHRTDDLRLYRPFFFMYDAKPVLTPQGHDQLGKFFVRDPGPQLPVKRIGGRLAQGKPVNFFNAFSNLRQIEKSTPDLFGVAFQALVGPETRP
jgi:hypothetical protein